MGRDFFCQVKCIYDVLMMFCVSIAWELFFLQSETIISLKGNDYKLLGMWSIY